MGVRARRPAGVVRLKLESKVWVGGIFGVVKGRGTSYAAGYPHPQDLWLAVAVDVDPVTGELRLDERGNVRLLRSGLLVRFDEVEILDFIGNTGG